MTDQQFTVYNPYLTGRERLYNELIQDKSLKPGDILLLSCSVCGGATPHLWGGWPPLACQDAGHAARVEERAKAKAKK